VRILEILYQTTERSKKTRFRPQLDSRSVSARDGLTELVNTLTKNGRIKHFRYLNWSRALLSKSRYMCRRQCSKKLWRTVYDAEPAQEPLRKGIPANVRPEQPKVSLAPKGAVAEIRTAAGPDTLRAAARGAVQRPQQAGLAPTCPVSRMWEA
jgi:hypothetical protein